LNIQDFQDLVNNTNMRIALCFSGQPRFITEAAPYIIENVCKSYNVDVFAHFWFDESITDQPYKYGGSGKWVDQRISKSSISDFVSLYKPVKYFVEPSRPFLDSKLKTDYCYKPNGELVSWSKHWKESTEPNYRNRMVNNWLSYHYSLAQVNRLKKEYEYENDFRYDFVVKSRSDTILHTKFRYENYDPNCIHYALMNQPDNMVSDWINFGGSSQMDVFMNTFNTFDSLVKNCEVDLGGAWCNEIVHKKALDLFNIKYQGHKFEVYVPRF